MNTRATRVAAAAAALILWTVPQAGAQVTPKIDVGQIDLDGKIGIDAVRPAQEKSSVHHPIALGFFDFEDILSPPACTPQGWTSHDRTTQDHFYYHVADGVQLNGGSFGRLNVINGAHSLWCGVYPNQYPEVCNYVSPPGYGNNWDQGWCTKNCLNVTGTVQIDFTAFWDSEPCYDVTKLQYDLCDNNWQTIGGPYDGIGPGATISASIPAVSHAGSVRIRFRSTSDGAWSDEDGLLDTDGMFILDDLTVSDGSGVVLATEDFEGVAVDATSSNDWQACLPGGAYGDFACLVNGTTVFQEVPPVDKNLSCMWAFYCGSIYNYSCGAGGSSQATVPYKNADDLYINNEIWSPWLTFVGPLSSTTHMDFDVYKDLKLSPLVFYTWHVRTRSVPGGCPTPWISSNFVYYGPTPGWYTHSVNFTATPGFPPSASIAEMQVALGVIDMCQFWCGIYGTGACHSHSPLFDNIDIYRSNTQAWAVEDADLFQDAFPTNGLLIGTCEVNTPNGDVATVTVNEPEFGIDYLTHGVPASGPAVFCHVKTIGAKAGAVVSGGASWPYIAAMSTPDWTVIQMRDIGGNQYDVDLNDALYTPGDTIWFFFSARDGGGGTSYYSRFTQMVKTLPEVLAEPMEMTCLPTGDKSILYVDDYSGHGAEPYFNQAFELVGIADQVDRYDRRSPEMKLSNGLGDAANFFQIEGYDLIIWDSGNLYEGAAFGSNDFVPLLDYLNLIPDRHHAIWFTGDNIASELANSGDPAAVSLRTSYINYNLVDNNHRNLMEPISPNVIGTPGSFYDQPANPDTIVAYGGTPVLNSFDVITAAGPSTQQMNYSNNAAHGAVVRQQTLALPFSATVVMQAFGFHNVRDNYRKSFPWAGLDREEHFEHTMAALGFVVATPTGADESVAYGDRLWQNNPNPFNPSTSISYSIEQSGHVYLAIYDVSGRLIRTLVDGNRSAGRRYEATWDGRNNNGSRVASGVYFYRIRSGRFSAVNKMVLLK